MLVSGILSHVTQEKTGRDYKQLEKTRNAFFSFQINCKKVLYVSWMATDKLSGWNEQGQIQISYKWMGALLRDILCKIHCLQWGQELSPQGVTQVSLHWCNQQAMRQNSAGHLTPLGPSFWLPGPSLGKQHVHGRCCAPVLCSLKHS